MPWVIAERVAALGKDGGPIAFAAPGPHWRGHWWELADELYGLLGDRATSSALMAQTEEGREAPIKRRGRPGAELREVELWDSSVGAWSMWPDYGGAALWDETGACSEASVEDFGDRLSEAKGLDLLARLDRWQLGFESRVPHEGSRSGFEWSAFHCAGSVLARALSDASGRMVVYERPYEDEDSERDKGGLWIDESDEPAAREAKGAELGRALAALDEERAIEAMEGWAPRGPLMAPGLTAAHICAALGFERALKKALAAAPELAVAKDGWGCSPLGAAVFSKSAECAAALIEAGASLEEADAGGRDALERACAQLSSRGEGGAALVEELARRAGAGRLKEEGLEALSALAMKPARERLRSILERVALERGSAAPAASRGPGRSL